MLKDKRFVGEFEKLGNSWELSEESIETFEHYVCQFYFVCKMWKPNKRYNPITLPEISENGWYHSGDIQWITEQFPEEVTDDLLMGDDDNNEDNDEYGTDDKTDEDSDEVSDNED